MHHIARVIHLKEAAELQFNREKQIWRKKIKRETEKQREKAREKTGQRELTC